MGRRYKNSDDSLWDDYELEEAIDEGGLSKKCPCGHYGPVVPALHGFECEDCGYLVIDFNR